MQSLLLRGIIIVSRSTSRLLHVVITNKESIDSLLQLITCICADVPANTRRSPNVGRRRIYQTRNVNRLTAVLDYISFYCNIKCHILNRLYLKHDNNQQDLKKVHLHFACQI